jgi:hypothetical protein
MSLIQKNISNFIESQFPEIYRDEGPVFVEFVKKYYEWLENKDFNSNSAVTYHSRRILDYKDIDDTVDEFVLYFKEKYLKEIQLSTVSQTRQLVKHSLDLYRSKGTERAVDLFFRAVFGRPAEVYYPGEDIFRLSDGKWIQPKYLEVTPSKYNEQFVGKQIVGINTGATAFVERYIKRKIESKYIHILYISSINGEFETGELLTLDGQVLKEIPTVIGSMTTLEIVTGGASFKIGDIVDIQSDNGLQGKGRVADISDITGIVDFDIAESGWGYSSSANVFVSQKVLYLENIIPLTTSNGKSFFEIFETIKQPQSNVVYKNANASISFANGDFIFTYYSNNAMAGKGVVINSANTSATNGEVYVVELVGNLSPVVEPAANSSGTVSVTNQVGPLTGYASINTTSANINGTSTLFTAELVANSIVKIFAYNTNNVLLGTEFKKVVSITSDTVITVDSNLGFTSANTIIHYMGNKTIEGTGTAFNTDFVYGDKVVFYSNSTNYYIRTVNAVSNATYMTIQETIPFLNTAANYAKVVTNNFIYTSSNTVKANIHTYADKSATGNVIGSSANLTFYLTNTHGTFSRGQTVFQRNANTDIVGSGYISSVAGVLGTNATLYVSNSQGVFHPNNTSFSLFVNFANGTLSSSNGYLNRIDATAGIINATNSFVNNYFVVGNTTSTNATVVRVSSGILADFDISNTLQYSETITLLSDRIEPYLDIPLNAPSFGFPRFPTANVTTQYLEDIFEETQLTIGGISSLTGINPGKNYDTPPYVLVYEPNIAPFNKTDYSLDITNVVSSFIMGEIVTQPDTAAIGMVKHANSTHLTLKRLQFNNQFDTSNGLIGSSSGATANIASITTIDNILQIGVNANVVANVQTATGSVTKIDVVDSGFGYLQGENADFTSTDGLRSGSAKVSLGKKGVSQGFYKNRKGFISDSKKIFDGEYYQDYSYEVRTSITADKYTEMLKKVLHVAGTKQFSSTVLSGSADMTSNIKTDITEE